ncbi:bifunctional Ribosomal protein P2/Ribosomal protein P1-P2 [Babesia duncani]|uniref:Bifunctional Ribosomal protein P2/Ribosomal protein P1-P2 n=1 Tax=Babesia duncani TaxID=323732 RepID=A0AAD9UP83_9APIC|nr:bifunctional Ribosomal protein P2/Ribosomal protein P1-P2 [Babesia duncani]
MGLKYVASYLLAVAAGNANPSKSDIKSILTSVGCEVEDGALDGLFDALDGKDIYEVMNNGMSKLQNVSMGGGAPVAGGAAAAAGGAGDAKKEAEPEPEEEEEDDMGFSLFD